MTQVHEHRHIPLILWPFWAVWRLLEIILGLTGRLIAAVLGLVFMIVGLVLTITILAAPVGIPMIIFGFLLILRGFF